MTVSLVGRIKERIASLGEQGGEWSFRGTSEPLVAQNAPASGRPSGRPKVGDRSLTNVPLQIKTERVGDEVLVASGERTRNRDYWTGKPYRLDPSGMRLDGWRKNPVMLYMHNFVIPLGTAEMQLRDGKLWAENIKFHRRVIPFADNWMGASGDFDTGVIADLWEEGYLNATSIHIILSPEDEQNIIETEDEILMPTSEVIEFSIVTIPGDRESVRQELLSRGVCQDVAQCLLPRTSVSLGREVTMSDEVILEEVEEVQEVQEYEVEPAIEMELEVSDLIKAIINDPQALGALANALLSMPGFQAQAAPAEPPVPVQQRFTIKMVGQPQPQAQPVAQPVQRVVQQAQTRPVPSIPQPNGRVRQDPVLRLLK